MKILPLFLLATSLLSLDAFALKAEIKDTDAVAYAGDNSIFPQIVTVMQFDSQGPVRTGTITDLHCNSRSDESFERPLTDPERGIPRLDCYTGSDHKPGSTVGQRLNESSIYLKILQGLAFETPPGEKTYFKTYGDHDTLTLNSYDLKLLQCRVTLAVTELGKGRVSCVVDDGRP